MRSTDGVFRGPMDEATRRQISEGQISRHREIRELAPPLIAGQKHCSVCKQLKRFDTANSAQSEFSVLTRRNKAVPPTRYPAGACKKCAAAAKKARREGAEREAVLAARREYMRQYVAKPEKRELMRRQQREWSSVQRRLAGAAERGPWRKYRRTDEILFDIQPLLDWMAEGGYQVHEKQNRREAVAVRALNRARESGVIELRALDGVLVALGRPDALALFVPRDKPE